MRSTIPARSFPLLLGFASLATGCADAETERPPKDLVQLRPVESTTAPPCAAAATRFEDVCLVLGPVRLDSDDIATARRTANPPTGVALSLVFTREGDEEFEALATAQLRRQIAVVVDGRVAAAPTVQEPASSGGIVVTGIDDADVRRVAAAFAGADS